MCSCRPEMRTLHMALIIFTNTHFGACRVVIKIAVVVSPRRVHIRHLFEEVIRATIKQIGKIRGVYDLRLWVHFNC